MLSKRFLCVCHRVNTRWQFAIYYLQYSTFNVYLQFLKPHRLMSTINTSRHSSGSIFHTKIAFVLKIWSVKKARFIFQTTFTRAQLRIMLKKFSPDRQTVDRTQFFLRHQPKYVLRWRRLCGQGDRADFSLKIDSGVMIVWTRCWWKSWRILS